jgi:hypothetical protein
MYLMVMAGHAEITGESDLIWGPDGLRASLPLGSIGPLVYLYIVRMALWLRIQDCDSIGKSMEG